MGLSLKFHSDSQLQSATFSTRSRELRRRTKSQQLLPKLVTEAKLEARKPLPAALAWRCKMLEDLAQNRLTQHILALKLMSFRLEATTSVRICKRHVNSILRARPG